MMRQAVRSPARCLLMLLAALLLALPAAAPAVDIVDALPFENHAQEVRFQKLASQLRCLVCQDESLAASGAELAQQMRHIVFEKMQAGWSDKQIKQYMVDRYSDYVLYKPPFKPHTWLLWLGPPVVLLLGGLTVLLVVRARRHDPIGIEEADDDDW